MTVRRGVFRRYLMSGTVKADAREKGPIHRGPLRRGSVARHLWCCSVHLR